MKPGKFLLLLLVITVVTILLARRGKEEVAPSPVPALNTPERAVRAKRLPRTNAVPSEAAGSIATNISPASPDLAEDPLANGNRLQVLVQSDRGLVIEGAAVLTTFREANRRPTLTNLSRTFITGPQGIADVLWPTQNFAQLEMLVSKDDFEARKVVWDFKTGDSVAASYTVRLRSAVHIGGIVVDPEGRPVPDATVSLSRFWRGGETPLPKGEAAAFPAQKHTTTADGRWTARNVPPDLLSRITITGSHSNYVGVTVMMEDMPQVEQELRRGDYLLRLIRGLEVRGRVVNEQQQPIAGARVWAGRKYTRDRQETGTDAQGRFNFRNINAGKMDFSVTADGYAPHSMVQDVTAAGTDEIVIQLSPGSVIRGLVQNESRQPIEGVRVVLEGTPGDLSYDRFDFSTVTDAAGRFEWKGAPNTAMPFYIGKVGYEQKRGVRLKPAEENVVTLRTQRTVEGQVVDAVTGGPVKRFKIAIGQFSPTGLTSVNSFSTKEFTSENGTFTVGVDEERSNGIQANATGYAELTQILPQDEGGVIKVVLAMKPSPTLTGTVVTPDGRPVEGANVVVVKDVVAARSVQVRGGAIRVSDPRNSLFATTDASGRFEINSPPETGDVIAASGTGFASTSLAEVKASGVVVLQSLGRIEGVLRQGTDPGAGQELTLTSPAGPQFDIGSTTQTTDAAGHFAFEKVPAGNLAIVRLVRTSPAVRSYSHSTEVVVTAGETTRVELGGRDATLYGQAKFESGPPNTEYLLNASLSTVAPQPPAGLDSVALNALLRSPEWREQMKNVKQYSAVVGPDGILALDSVPPGQYTLRVTAIKAEGTSLFTGNSAPLAQGTVTITVPAGAHPGAPISVGEVVLKSAK